MKKVILAVLTLFSVITMQGCGRDNADKPSPQMLVGNWANSAGDRLYYNTLSADGSGVYYLVQAGGRTFEHKYKIAYEGPKNLIVKEMYASGNSSLVTISFSKAGKRMVTTKEVTGMEISSEYDFVDEKTKPE